MQFLQHPLYDQAPLREWVPIDLHVDSAPPSSDEFDELLAIAASNVERFTLYALDRIREHAGTAYLSERPYPEINSVLFRPTSSLGFQIYVEYFFLEDPNENSPDSDVWWAIINCPNATQPDLRASLHFNVTDLGWTVV